MKLKKLLAAVTTGVLAVTSLSLSGLVSSAEVQELMNDTFESGYGAWKGVGSSLSLSTEQSHSGGTSLYCYDRTASWGAPRCSLTGIVAAGQSYEISASAMYEGSGQQNMAIKMIYTDANGTDHYDQVAAAQATAGQWVEMKGNYTVPNGATGMILYVEMPNAGTDQTYYIDDVVIKGEKTEIQLDDKFESDFDNNSTQKWNGRGSAKVELSTKYAHSGTTSLYVSGRTQLWNGATRSASDIMEAGGYYKVGTYVLYDGDQYTDTQKFSINLQYDLNGKENYYTIATETANKGEWKYVGSEFTVPEGATNFYVYVQTGYTSAPKEQDLMNFYMDDAVGEHLPDPAIQDDIASLKDAYSDYFKIGCACAGSEFAQGATKDLIKKHYNSLTLGNEKTGQRAGSGAVSEVRGRDRRRHHAPDFPQRGRRDAEICRRKQDSGTWPCAGMAQPDTGLVLQGKLRPQRCMGLQGQDDQASGKLHQDRHGNAGKGLSGCGILRMGRGERGCLRCRNHS